MGRDGQCRAGPASAEQVRVKISILTNTSLPRPMKMLGTESPSHSCPCSLPSSRTPLLSIHTIVILLQQSNLAAPAAPIQTTMLRLLPHVIEVKISTLN